MAEEGEVLTDLNLDMPEHGPANGLDELPTAGVIQQYVKDLSVENPNSPACYQWPGLPDIDVQFNIASTRVNEEIHEVELKVAITAKAPQGTAFAIELLYCGLIGIRNLPDDQAHAFLFAEAPRFLFPFAREIIASAVRDAGFAPLLLDPIDFQGLYLQQLEARQVEQLADDGPPVGNA